ncbi:MAG TPA: hypothetical protein VJ761_05590 [Ktedonobacteraceae bacterium]|nr:hypothetical protein [Ktedonobacteraceae bacterium]
MPGETVLYQLFGARWEEAQNSLQKALESKADRYGALQLPYVIAVDVLAIDSLAAQGELYLRRDDEEQAHNAFRRAATIVLRLADTIGDEKRRVKFLEASVVKRVMKYIKKFSSSRC